MDKEQRERIQAFEERQKRREKRENFAKIFGNPESGYLDFLGSFAIIVFLILLVVRLVVLPFKCSFSKLIKRRIK